MPTIATETPNLNYFLLPGRFSLYQFFLLEDFIVFFLSLIRFNIFNCVAAD
jgi:hypothetical protein